MAFARTASATLLFALLNLSSLSSAHAGIPPTLNGEDLGDPAALTPYVEKKIDGAKATVVVFLSAKCPCSASHEETLRSLSNEFTPKGFQFIGVHSNRDETLEAAKGHFQSLHLPFPVIEDGKAPNAAPLATAYGALKTPHVFVVSKTGEVLFSGGVDDSKNASHAKRHFLADALAAIEAGKNPAIRETRTLGCVIKRNAE